MPCNQTLMVLMIVFNRYVKNFRFCFWPNQIKPIKHFADDKSSFLLNITNVAQNIYYWPFAHGQKSISLFRTILEFMKTRFRGLCDFAKPILFEQFIDKWKDTFHKSKSVVAWVKINLMITWQDFTSFGIRAPLLFAKNFPSEVETWKSCVILTLSAMGGITINFSTCTDSAADVMWLMNLK